MTNSGNNRLAVIYPILILSTVIAYWGVQGNEFLRYDDQGYITENPHVNNGLTLDNIRWAFTTGSASNWHPLTWISHMIDCHLFGLEPAGHHIHNLVLHLVNALLLFELLRRMTGAVWRSAFVAAAFALHPMHVESVAWAAERKDVLSGLFWMLTLLAYLNYVKNPKPARYLAVLMLFALGLMSKPMLVTLPFVMLLLDYWPLCRVQGNLSGIQSLPPGKLIRTVHCPKFSYRRLLGEKVPLFILAFLSCIVTYLVQQKGGAMKLKQMGHAPLISRMTNMLVSYFDYVHKMVYPVNLSILYPFPEDGLPAWKPILALLFLAAISIFAVVQLRRRPYLLVGWLWFLGTLVPVTGLIQVGVQSMADRYTYIPYTGLFIIVSWGLPDIFRKWRLKKVVLCIMATSSIVAMTLCTARQVGYWKNGLALFGHALDATKNNYVMSFSLALEFAARGRTDKAIEYHQKALQINPSYTYSSINLGYIYESSGHLDKAIDYYRQATEADPESVPAWINLGNSFKAQGKHDEAIKHYRRALEIEPDRSYTHYNLALTLTAHDKIDEAVHHYRQAIRLNTDDYRSHSNLGSILLSRGMTDQAVGHFKRALEIKPGFAAARSNLNRAVQMKADQSDSAPEKQPETAREWNDYGLDLASSGNLDKALDCFLKAVELDPQLAEAYNNIGNVFFMRKKNGQAIEYYRKVIELSPNHPLAHYNLALALEGEGKNEEAAKHLQKHLEINPGSEAAMKKLEQLMNSPKRDR